MIINALLTYVYIYIYIVLQIACTPILFNVFFLKNPPGKFTYQRVARLGTTQIRMAIHAERTGIAVVGEIRKGGQTLTNSLILSALGVTMKTIKWQLGISSTTATTTSTTKAGPLASLTWECCAGVSGATTPASTTTYPMTRCTCLSTS